MRKRFKNPTLAIIRTVSGNSNVNMTKEEIIRGEASEFAFYRLDGGSFGYNGHKEFISELQSQLSLYYQPEYKMVYLDQVKNIATELMEKHNNECPEGEDCDTYRTYQKILFFVGQEVDELPKIVHQTVSENPQEERTKVFISYSHDDHYWLTQLRRHFKPFESKIDFWDDSKIKPGGRWKSEIEDAIDDAKVAILLISADFFNSQFITENELPPLLESAENGGATILSVILKPCMFEEYPGISQYQAINSPNRTLLQMNEADRELTWVELVKQIKSIIKE